MFVKASTIIANKATGSINALIGACPTEVQFPFGLCNLMHHHNCLVGCVRSVFCCLATLPDTQRSTLLVNQSLHATASN